MVMNKNKTADLSMRKKFIHFSGIRMKKLELIMKSVGNLANKRYYDYTNSEKEQIKKDIKKWFNDLMQQWNKDWKKKGANNAPKLGYWDEKNIK